jgi:hypothetical protein
MENSFTVPVYIQAVEEKAWAIQAGAMKDSEGSRRTEARVDRGVLEEGIWGVMWIKVCY